MGPDVLTLRVPGGNGAPPALELSGGGVALAVTPPKVRIRIQPKSKQYAAKAKAVVIRHVRAVIGSWRWWKSFHRGTRTTQNGLNAFVRKAQETLAAGIHLLLVDLFPPSPGATRGIHGAGLGGRLR